MYFLPLPQGHLSLRPILLGFWVAKVRFSWHWTQVQAWGCSAYQLGLTIFHLGPILRGGYLLEQGVPAFGVLEGAYISRGQTLAKKKEASTFVEALRLV